MILSRRILIKLACTSFFSIWFSRLSAYSTEPSTTDVLSKLVDVLIPADELTPSATALDVDKKILEKIVNDSSQQQLIKYGCRWLNRISNKKFNKDFSDLTFEQQNFTVEILAQKRRTSTAALFFRTVRNEAMEIYYSNPYSWQGLGINNPPQPVGYVDYKNAPEHS